MSNPYSILRDSLFLPLAEWHLSIRQLVAELTIFALFDTTLLFLHSLKIYDYFMIVGDLIAD